MARTLMGVVFICVSMTVAGLVMGIPYAGPLHSNSIAAGDMPLKLPHQNNRSQSSAYAYVL